MCILWANSEKKAITFHIACSKSYEFLPRAIVKKFPVKLKCKLAEEMKLDGSSYPSVSHHYGTFYQN